MEFGPEGEQGSQIILQGRVAGRLSSRDFARRGDFMPQVLDSFARLSDGADLVIVEGAGSPAETNLRARDIANLGFARAALPRRVAGGNRRLSAPEGIALDEIGHLGDLVARFTQKPAAGKKPA